MNSDKSGPRPKGSPVSLRLPSSSNFQESESSVISRSAHIEESVLIHISTREFNGVMELADFLGKTRSTVSRAVSNLRRRGLLVEGKKPELTPLGKEEVKRIVNELPVRNNMLEELKEKIDIRIRENKTFSSMVHGA